MRLALISRRRCEYATRENRYVDDRGGVLDDGGGCRSRARPRASTDASDDVRCTKDPDPYDQSRSDEDVGTDDDNQVHDPRAVHARLVSHIDDDARTVAEVDDNARLVAEADDHDSQHVAEVDLDNEAS
jgi:hypothetical protein